MTVSRVVYNRLQPVTEMITRNIKIIIILGSKVWLVLRPDNLTTIYEPIV
jgi:hypothetical protein